MVQRLPRPTFPWAKKDGEATGKARSFPWLLLGMVLLCLLTLLSLYQSSRTDAARQRTRNLYVQKLRLERQNAALLREIAGYEKIEWVLKRAQEMGFVFPEREAVVHVPVMLERELPYAPLPAEASLTARKPIWREWLEMLRARLPIPGAQGAS